MAIERTFSIIKPNAVEKNAMGAIITRFEQKGLRIAAAKLTRLTREKAEGFYIEHKDRPFFQSLVHFMTSGPVMLMVLEGENAVMANREIMGATDPAKAAPGTIRKDFADSIEANAVHGSDSTKSAEREIAYFFDKADLQKRY
jgi:nucleoside-diphosphate kinase